MEKLEEKDFIFYRSPASGEIIVRVAVKDDTIWSTQKGIAIIFKTTKQNVSKHLKNIFENGELVETSVVNQWLTTGPDGKDYKTKVYNLDAIISVGYRVQSYEATQFRIWATKVLKEYLIKGFALDDTRLKQGSNLFGKDYFAELLERIREIRASERRFNQKLTDLYRDASVDYNKDSPTTRLFYSTAQNKLLFAVTGRTAAEIIKDRVNAKNVNMGLSTWSAQGYGGKIIYTDIVVSKNYLHENEIKELNRIVSMFLDYAENLVERGITMKMDDWANTLDTFLTFNRYEPLDNSGTISKKVAENIAKREYEKFRIQQDKDFVSDFDSIVQEIKTSGKLPPSKPDDKEPLSD